MFRSSLLHVSQLSYLGQARDQEGSQPWADRLDRVHSFHKIDRVVASAVEIFRVLTKFFSNEHAARNSGNNVDQFIEDGDFGPFVARRNM
jgi:hypothetical protein